VSAPGAGRLRVLRISAGGLRSRVSVGLVSPASVALAGLLALWLVWSPRSPDLAAQVYRIRLFSHEGYSLWDENWYAGHYLPAYSLLFPPLAAFLGLHWAGVASASASTLIFGRIAKTRFAARSALSSTLFALGAAGDLFIGRVTFAAGVSLGLAAVLASIRGRLRWATLLSLACAASSPVAGAFLVLAGCAELLHSRRLPRACALAIPALALIVLLGVLFPEGGYEGFSFSSLLAAGGLSLGVLLLLPVRERLLQTGTALYLLALLLSYLVPSPMGSNSVRLGVLFGPAILAGAVDAHDARAALSRQLRWIAYASRGRFGIPHAPSLRTARVVLAAIGVSLMAWQLNGPVVQSLQASAEASTHPGYYTPVIAYLDRQSHGTPLRIEVPFSRSHWDAVILSRSFALARGWERQLDTEYDALFYEPVLSASAYHAWLLNTAVRFVVLSDAPPDFSSVAEDELIRAGLPFLREVFHSRHWRVYEVVGAQPLASGPGKLTSMTDGGFTLQATHAGSFLVRIHYTPYWQLIAGSASIDPAAGGWTRIVAKRPGRIAIAAELRLTT
jgi:hypothetical protein